MFEKERTRGAFHVIEGVVLAQTEIAPPPPAALPIWSPRYEMLDSWRGLAALAVVVYHLTGSVLGFGPSAVIVFFVISGYCITSAAEAGLAKGFTFRKFMWRRVRRIYPPYLFSLLFFLITRAVKVAQGGENELLRSPLEYLQNFTMTQWLTLLAHPQPPNDNPTLFVGAYWSLNYEEQFYLLMAGLISTTALGRLQLKHFVFGLLGVSLVWNAVVPFKAFGIFIDYWAHFSLGAVVFYRLCRPMPRWLRRVVDGGLVVLFAGTVLLAWLRPAPGNRSVYLELAVASGFAIVLLVCRAFDDSYRKTLAGKLLGKLGLISYSLYLTHQFNIVLTRKVVTRLLPAATPELILLTVQLALVLTIAVAFWYGCERPFLNKNLADAPASRRAPAHPALGVH